MKITNDIIRGAAVALLVILTIYLYPRYDHAFAYRYEVGKPWSYGRLVADFDFPIYKTDAQLDAEREDVLREVVPYYTFVAGQPHRPLVMSMEQREQLQEAGVNQIAVLNNQVSKTYYLREIYTPKTAYLATGEEVAVNLALDTASTNQVRRNLLRNISLTRGMVQTGEKIVDEGDIVSEKTAAILNSLKIAYEQSQTNARLSVWSVVGQVLWICLYVLLFALFLWVFRRKIFDDVKAVLFFCILVAFIVLLTSLEVKYMTLSIYLVPLAWIPVLVRSFYDSRTALYLHICTTMILSVITPDPIEYVFIQMAVGLVTVLSLKQITQRAQLATTAAWVWGTYVVTYTAYILGTTGSWASIDAWNYLYFTFNAVLIVGAYGLLFVFEKVFRLLSPVTLVELTDINSSLLLEFAEKAPGSFQHSMQVSTLAMDAAKRIGANSLLVRTGALYHDIGKMANPTCFTENQQGGVNPLEKMSLTEAAQMIKNHVKDGVAIARAHHLPEVIVHFIETHHGTSLTRYFYNSAINQFGEANEADFRYDGPKPSTKEAAILMMADAIEARSRTLKEYSEEEINTMVDDMINIQISDGQFNETSLSFSDVEAIKQVFKDRLLSMNHHRIKYPTIEK